MIRIIRVCSGAGGDQSFFGGREARRLFFFFFFRSFNSLKYFFFSSFLFLFREIRGGTKEGGGMEVVGVYFVSLEKFLRTSLAPASVCCQCRCLSASPCRAEEAFMVLYDVEASLHVYPRFATARPHRLVISMHRYVGWAAAVGLACFCCRFFSCCGYRGGRRKREPRSCPTFFSCSFFLWSLQNFEISESRRMLKIVVCVNFKFAFCIIRIVWF